MHKPFTFIFSLLLFYFLILPVNGSLAEDRDTLLASVLDSAETFFISLRDGEHQTAWKLLSEKSHDTIIDDVYTATRKIQKDIKKEDVLKDFLNRGLMFKNYWHAFTRNFDSNMILEESQWKIGYLNQNEAEIVISYRKSEQPARLRILKENNAWRVGLVETFWTRKYR